MARSTNTQFAAATHVLLLLAAAPERSVSSEEMAASVTASPVYLRRVLGRLREAGIVASRPGVGGGWHLLQPATSITLGDVWRAVQGDDPVMALHDPHRRDAVGREVMRLFPTLQARVERAIEDELDRTTLAHAAAPAVAGAMV